MSQKCPKCSLASPDSALRCDCGFDFESGMLKESYLHPRPASGRRLSAGQQQSSQQRRRPKVVWVITIFFAVSAIWTLLSFYLLYTGWLRLNAPQKAYFESLTLVDHAFTVLGASLNLVATAALFLMRKLAPYIFTANLALGVFVLPWHIATKGWDVVIGGAGLVGALIGWGILIAICLYSWRLLREGALT